MELNGWITINSVSFMSIKGQNPAFEIGDAVAMKLDAPRWMVRVIDVTSQDDNIRVYWEKAAD